MGLEARIRLALGLYLLAAPALVAGEPADRLDAGAASRIDKVFSRYARTDCPGCALGIARDDRVVYTRGYGMSNLEYAVPITPATVFEAGSVSKQFVAATVLLLARDGKLSLDDDIRKFVPEVPDFGRRITIRNILNHTSGLRDQWELFTIAGRPPGSVVHSLEDVLALVSRQRALNFDPGTEYLYSNMGFILMNFVVRRAAGKSLADHSRENLLEPAGMKHSSWRDDYTALVRGRATAYAPAKKGFRLDMPFSNVYGSGGLLTTVGDLLTWSAEFARPRVLDRAIVEQMTKPATLADGTRLDYGLGLVVGEYRGFEELSHSGSTAGYRAFLARYPAEKLSIALLCNFAGANTAALVHQVADVLLGGPPKASAPAGRAEISPGDASLLPGLYRNSAKDALVRVGFENGKLVSSLPGRAVLSALAPGRFGTPSGTEYRFEAAAAGEAARLFLVPPRGPVTEYTRVPEAVLQAGMLPRYTGRFRSPELDVEYAVAEQAGKLVLRGGGAAFALEPTFSDGFVAAVPGWLIRFTGAGDGTVDGFLLTTGRVRNLKFELETRGR